MGFILFFTFLPCNLFTCLICKNAYLQNFTYQNGMLLGVHIPREQVGHPQVGELCRQSQRHWKIYQNSHIAAGSLLCLLGFVSAKWMMLVWILWFMLYLAGMEILMATPLRRMYRLKQEQGWIREKTRRTVYIDTELSALSGQMAPKAFWHLLLMAAELGAAVALYLSGKRGQDACRPEALLLGGIAAGVTLLLWAVHLYLVERRNVVYSQSSRINIAVNQLVKRTWARAFLGTDIWNCVSWLYLALRWYQSGTGASVGVGDWFVYAALQLAAALFFLLPWGGGVRRKRELLESDGEPVEVDDDEYWKNGWYENPQDHHLFVPNRLCDTNYVLNMARPAARWLNAGITLLLVGSMVWAAWMIIERM